MSNQFTKSLGTWQVFVAGVALVVASSTLVSDFAGYFALGATFAVALALGFGINLLLGLSAADLSVTYPRAGALYDYTRAIFGGRFGQFAGTFLGLSVFGMFAFAASGETTAGAYGLKALLGSQLPVEVFVVACALLAVIPNLFGIRTTAWVSAALLVLMLGTRWFFGIAGFMGWGATGPWVGANLDAGIGIWDWFGTEGVLAAGLALAFWSFVGIEFACSLAEEVRQPRKALPRGLILGLLAILATSLIMGLGAVGTQPIALWREAAAGPLGNGGESPQLAVGQLMFGQVGYLLMALSSVAATLGSLTVAYAVMPRIIYSIARDGHFFGPLSPHFGTLHRRWGTPIAATLLTFVAYLLPALYSSAVVDWLYSAAYVWIILYVVFHLLALANRFLHPTAPHAFDSRWFVPAAGLGVVATIVSLYYAFAGSHFEYGSRALVVLGISLGATAVSFALKRKPTKKLDQHPVAPKLNASSTGLSAPALQQAKIAANH